MLPGINSSNPQEASISFVFVETRLPGAKQGRKKFGSKTRKLTTKLAQTLDFQHCPIYYAFALPFIATLSILTKTTIRSFGQRTCLISRKNEWYVNNKSQPFEPSNSITCSCRCRLRDTQYRH